ncbi:hypothetical protein DL1_00015 [Thioclava dalianensis]|uniref:Uncharacterized protein n=1 Tax=Thioclava dalianensis TaxID=1185766 RepID=A0A074TJG2_9RHOB|nr:hypothetical protein DL1_00015 [Thioclava dalianensis]
MSGCGSDEQATPIAPVIPPSLLVPCAAPVAITPGAMSDRDVEIGWGRDRAALRACGSLHRGLVQVVAPADG